MAGVRVLRRNEFVAAWQSAACVAEVARALGITKAAAMCRAWYLRKRGVPLRRFGEQERIARVIRCTCGAVVFAREWVEHSHVCRAVHAEIHRAYRAA